MIQDIFPHKLDNQFRPDTPECEDDLIFCVDHTANAILVSETFEELKLPERKLFPEPVRSIYLIRLDDRNIFLVQAAAADLPALNGFVWKTLRELRNVHAGPQYMMFMAYTGIQLSSWYRDNMFCGRCAHETVHSTTERAVVCPSCGRTIYPRIIPAVIVGVLDPENEKILVTKYAGRAITYNALVAGFTEIGETLEETVAREVMEEVGLKVRNIRYYKSQPWAMADDILMGFYCEVDGSREIRMDANELKEAHWVTRDELELQPDQYSLTNEMMTRFKLGQVTRAGEYRD